MNLTPFVLAGVAYLLLKPGKGSSLENSLHTVTSADDIPPEAPEGLDIVVASRNTLVVAGRGNAQATIVQGRNKYDALIGKNGDVYVKEGETEFVLSEDPRTISMGASRKRSRRGRTDYTAESPTRRGRDMSRVPVQNNYPEVNDCALAGQSVADWRWRKVDGRTERKDQKAPLAVSNSAAILASTPCEVYKKVAYGEMAPEAAIAELDAYYGESAFEEGPRGFALEGEDLVLETDSTYTRRRRYDS